MDVVEIPVTTTGTAGSATGTTDPAVLARPGVIMAAWVDYRGMPATADLVISENRNGTARTLVTLTSQNTDRVFVPLTQGQDAAGANIASQYAAGIPYFGGRLTAEFAQADAAAPAAIVYLLVVV